MSTLDQFVLELEAKEAAEDMHFSIYFIPAAYQPQESPYE
jgi:hypothetical protein